MSLLYLWSLIFVFHSSDFKADVFFNPGNKKPVDSVEYLSLKLLQGKLSDAKDHLILNPGKNSGSKITRIKYGGFYNYIFWDVSGVAAIAYSKNKIPVVDHNSDTLFDVNGDKTKDLLITWQPRNGQCQPKYCDLFCFDSSTGRFVSVDISGLPNPKFIPSKKIILAEITCMMTRDVYKLTWKSKFKLDTISSKSYKL